MSDEEDEYIRRIKQAAANGELNKAVSSIQHRPSPIKNKKAESFFSTTAEIFSRKNLLAFSGGRKTKKEPIEDLSEVSVQEPEPEPENGKNKKEKKKSTKEPLKCADPVQSQRQQASSSTITSSHEIIDLENINNVAAVRSAQADVIDLDEDDESPLSQPVSELNKSLDDEVIVRVKVDGRMEKFYMTKNDKMEVIFKELAQRLNISVSEIMLFYNEGDDVIPSDTPVKLGFGFTVILDFLRLTKHGQKRKSSDGSTVSLKFQDGNRKNVVELSVNKLDSFERIKREYIEERGIKDGNVNFQFDGEKILNTDTPADLDMDDGDCIDVTY